MNVHDAALRAATKAGDSIRMKPARATRSTRASSRAAAISASASEASRLK